MKCSKCGKELSVFRRANKNAVCFDCKAKSARARHIPKKTKTVLQRLQEHPDEILPKESNAFLLSVLTDVQGGLKRLEEKLRVVEVLRQKYPSAYAHGQMESLREQILSLAVLATLSEQSSMLPVRTKKSKGSYLTRRVLQERNEREG